MIPLAAFEEIIDASGAAPRIEAMLPIGVRARQLLVRTLLLGMVLVLADHRPAHLTRVHQALTALPEDDQRRLGVITDWRNGPHQLTYRQAEYTFGLVAGALAKDEPDGLPSPALQAICDDLLEASVPEKSKDASASLAVDWTDLETFSRPPPAQRRPLRRPRGLLGPPQEQPAAQPGRAVLRLLPVRRDHGARGERARRPRARPPRHPLVVPAQPGPRLRPRADRDARRRESRSATSSTTPATPTATQTPGRSRSGPPGHSSSRTSIPTTAAPRAPTTAPSSATGTCTAPGHPRPLLELGPLARTATGEQAADHDRKTAELARYKLGRITADDADGYHRVQCPAAMGKIRCPLRPASMTLDRDRPEILHPPEHPQACCAQQTITVPPEVNAKTAQKHDYPSAAWRRSYARRTGAERGFATAKDPATNTIARGWCRLMGLAPLMLFTTMLIIARNQRIIAAWDDRQQENARRAAAGLPPRTRRRRRKTLAMLAAAPP